MRNKRGISLIVLIITIVVIIILATAIIVNLAQTNIINNANKAVQKNNESQINEKAQILMMDYLTESVNGVTLEQFLQNKKELKEIDNYEINDDGTYKVVMNGYYVVIDEKNLNVTEAKICSDVEIGYKINEFLDGKLNVTVTIKSDVNIQKIVRPSGEEIVYGDLKEVKFEEEIAANVEYSYDITLVSGGQSIQTIVYKDDKAPNVNIELEKTTIYGSGKTINANITISDEKSGVNLDSCKWVLSTEPNKSVLTDSEYTGTFSSTAQAITTSAITEYGSYYIHVIAKDNVGNSSEIISPEIIVKNGTEISTPEDLQNVNATGNYYVVNDINMSGFDFTMIDATFAGTIDGLGHTISNLKIASSSSYAGIFSEISNGTIKNILFKDVDISSTGYCVGVIAANGQYGSTFEKVGITGKLSGSGSIGSFIGDHMGYKGTINFTNCYARTTITSSDEYDAGGFIGNYANDSSRPNLKHMLNITNCYVAFTTNATGRTGVFRGGYSVDNNNNQLVGETTVTDSYYNSNLFTLSVPSKISGTGLSTELMAKQESYANWDFENTWYIGTDGYPELKFAK